MRDAEDLLKRENEISDCRNKKCQTKFCDRRFHISMKRNEELKKKKSSLTILRVSQPQNKTKSLESEGQKYSPQVLYNPGNDNHTVRCLF